MQVLILGCGDIGARVGASLIEERLARCRRAPQSESAAVDL